MKQFISVLLLTALLLGTTGCAKESTPETNTNVTPSQPATTSDANSSTTEAFTETVTETGIVVTTKHYSVTLPSIWKDEYIIDYYSDESGGYSLRFKDKVSFETQGHSGHIFTIALDPAMGETLQEFFIGANDRYCGGLQVEGNKLFTLSTSFPTDVQFTSDRAEIYRTLYDTFQTVFDSFTPTTGNLYYPVGFETFEQRARLTTHAEKGQKAINNFMADTNLELTYLGIALEPLTYQRFDNYDHGFHIYIPNDGTKTYYCVPFNEIKGTLEMVYQMTEYPNLEQIWTYESQEDRAYNAFLRGLAKEDSEALYNTYDIDQDGTKDLLVNWQTAITLYQYQQGRVVQVGSYDFETATFELRYGSTKEDGSLTDTTPYPGLFTRTVGGGQNHYGILTLENGKLVHTPLWDENYSNLPDAPATTEHSTNKELIEASNQTHSTLKFYFIEDHFGEDEIGF